MTTQRTASKGTVVYIVFLILVCADRQREETLSLLQLQSPTTACYVLKVLDTACRLKPFVCSALRVSCQHM